MGALIHSKIFVSHKFQSHGNNSLTRCSQERLGSQESSLTTSISEHYCLCSIFFSLNSFNSSRGSNSCFFYYASGGFTLFDCNVLVLEIILARASDFNTPTKNRDQIISIDIFLQIMACKLTNLSDFTPDKNLSCSEAGRRRL